MIHGIDDILMLDMPGEPNRRTQYQGSPPITPTFEGGGTTRGKGDCTEEHDRPCFATATSK